MNKKAEVFVIGSATWDVLFTTPTAKLLSARKARQRYLAFEYGGKLDAKEVEYSFGGGAANVSVGLSRLGIKTSIVTRVGLDWLGQEVLKNLRLNKVGVKHIQKDKKENTPLSFVVTTGGARDHVAFIARSCAQNLVVPSVCPTEANWLYINSLATNDWYEKLDELFTSANKKGTKIFWNPGARQLSLGKKLSKLIKKVDILDLNRQEAEYLVKDFKLKDGNAAGLLKAIHKAGAKNVLMTEGGQGAHFYDGHKIYFHPAFKVVPTNTTGAGDAFGCGFLSGYISSGYRINHAMRWGMLNAHAVILKTGAQKGLLRLNEIKLVEHNFCQASGLCEL